MKRVVVGMSGGVDSSVAAYLLQKQGYEVIGMFMKNWHDDSVTISKECPWLEDSNDAMIVAQNLGIPFQAIDLSKEYKERIVDYMFDEYSKGRTPNPDVLCNREIKFDIFLKAAMRLKADYIATGHYCRKGEEVINGETRYKLLAGVDGNKDQSYFLCQLTQEQLSKALFPIGELTKPQVREIAKEMNLVTADKKDSQGLCFIGKVRLPEFLQQQLKPKKGKVIEVPADSPIYKEKALVTDSTQPSLTEITDGFTYKESDGKVVGEHSGAHYFTIGQRKGLNIGGTPEPLFIIETDTENNIIYTGQGENHPGLYRNGLFITNEDIHWIRPDLELEVGESKEFDLRIRYRQPLEKATLYKEPNGIYVVFNQPQKAVAPGQFATWYNGEELIGSGVIN
ncbi:tRNA 2-thiouridine(34) synthase MnmA [Fulvivirga lutea]|uniref:tRNA-specific 2-thiouridylase MnmA n=1 Tax=Fulvivirga lutea TaxID=2810512 RepID=A0A974WMK0_9BACT|nr:tRNA 2-thiouridine(34) synthase MnmA [Fulvivirga lutea]QSE99035.1 tRNA 2-thiouridine(34) synthase MnmA [Fulvivirga lutea]